MNANGRIAVRIAGGVLFLVGLWGGCYACMGALPPTHWAQIPSAASAIIMCMSGFVLVGELWK